MDVQYLSDEKGQITAVIVPIKEWERIKSKYFDIDNINNELPILKKEINNSNFEIGFWHPFGRHGGMSKEEIIKSKNEQIEKNGWTLWSFQFRHDLKLWFEEIEKLKPKKVLVFCSDGKGEDPGGEKNKDENIDKYIHKMYKPINESDFREIPDVIQVTLPSKKNKHVGSAFIVEKINNPVNYENMALEWLLKDGLWQTTRLPTRGEYLIKSGNAQPMRKFKTILELKYPYLAEIKKV